MPRLKLNQCKCGKTYNKAEYGTTMDLCYDCNEKRLKELKRKDSLRKRDGRNDSVSNNLEKLAKIEE